MLRNPADRAATPFLALACVGFLVSAPAHAETATETPADSAEADQQRSIVVTGANGEGELNSPKATAPLLDTPQTVTVVSDQTIRKQNLLTLRDALATIPGITFGAGEGGGGYGDSINLRGYSANNDITVDGVRDSAQYSRTDPFNLQQIEIYNGSNSVFNGSGSVGGTINLVSKTPQAEDLTILQGAIGTDDYYRATVDSNHRLSERVAVRLNGMFHRNDVPGRDVEKYERWGIAPSLTIGIDSPTSLTLSYLHQQDDNTPVYGVPYFKSLVNAGPLEEVDSSDYFGIRNLDEQDTTVDRLTAEFRHAFSDAVSLRNLTRWQRVRQYSQTSAPQGTFCLSSTGLQPVGATGDATTGIACPADLAPGFYRPSGPRGLVRDQVNELLQNQTDLHFEAGDKGGIFNTLVVGGSFTQEDYAIETAQLLRNPGGALPNPLQPDIDLSAPDTVYTGPVNYTATGNSYGDTRNWAIYAFDTLELGSMVELNAGVRYENARTIFRADTVTTPDTGAVYTRGADQVSDDNLFSYRFGAVFKPADNISLYAAYANSKTPSSASVRTGCVTSQGDLCDIAPEKARTYEIGAKAAIPGGLQLTAALFRNERSNFRVPSNEPGVPDPQVLDGRARVDGFALGISGNITPAWTVFANYTYLDSEVLQSVSDFCLATPGATGCGNSAANPDPQAGQHVLQTPRHSGSLFTTYRMPFGLELGYGLTYQGNFALNNRVEAGGVVTPQFRSDDYLVHRLFASYPIDDRLAVQLNVQNLTDELYYASIRNNVSSTTGAISGGWATPGEGRSAVLSLFYSF